jgi:uncharacterized membrane protein
MQIRPLTDGDYIRTWVLFFVCAGVGGAIAGGIGGGITGLILGIFSAVHRLPIETFKLFCGAAGFIVALPVHFFLFRFFVSRLIASKAMETTDGLPPQLP